MEWWRDGVVEGWRGGVMADWARAGMGFEAESSEKGGTTSNSATPELLTSLTTGSWLLTPGSCPPTTHRPRGRRRSLADRVG
jgi:hypothetical protein